MYVYLNYSIILTYIYISYIYKNNLYKLYVYINYSVILTQKFCTVYWGNIKGHSSQKSHIYLKSIQDVFFEKFVPLYYPSKL